MDALQNLMDDMESSTYYGRGEDPAVAARPKQKGLKTLLSVNNTTNPTNAGAYKATDFIRDTLAALPGPAAATPTSSCCRPTSCSAWRPGARR